MDDYELIRRKHIVEGLSKRAVARELGHSRNTVDKAIENPLPPGYRLFKDRPRPQIDGVRQWVDAWLEQDRHGPRKQRHTVRRIYERLRQEYGFTGSYSAVRRYVRNTRPRYEEIYMPLQFEPGEEGQVDWHEGWVVQNGTARKLQFFCMRLCYSKASFVQGYERATLEAFLDGHLRAFEYFGGVPRRLAYDNLRSAVIQVKHGRQRRLNDRFKELRCWYLFDTRFCNLGKGNEKGDVENLAKRSERTYLTPVPHISSVADLNDQLVQCCRNDLELAGPRPHGERSRRELLEEDKAGMLPLPESRFQACRQESTFVSKFALVQADTNCYSAPVAWAHHPVVVKVFVDKVEVLCHQQRVAVHERCYDRGQYILEPEHYLPLLERKPGSLDNARPFKGQPWGEELQFMRRELEYRYADAGTRQYIEILLLMTEHDPEAVKQAVALCTRRRAFSYEAVRGILRNEPVRPFVRLNLADRPNLVLVGNGMRPASIYDQLIVPREVAV